MKTGIHSAIKLEYDRRQIEVALVLDGKLSEIYLKVPEIEDIDKKISECGIKCNKSIILNGSNTYAVDSFLTELKTLKLKKAYLLRQYGYPESYLEATYKCDKCGDTGFADGNECQCYRQKYIDILYKQSNLISNEKESFKNFKIDIFKDQARKNIIEIKEKCISFIDNFDDPNESNLFFTGPVGVGKTFVSHCIAKELLERGRTVLYQTAPLIFDILNEHKVKAFGDESYQDSAYKSLFEVELLIIDDLGTESSNSTRYAQLLNLLNQRGARNQKVVCKNIISTNLKLEEITEFYTERVTSRIAGNYNMFKFIGNDLRVARR